MHGISTMRVLGGACMSMGAALAMSLGRAGYRDPFSPVAGRGADERYGTGWRDRRYQHPDGPSSFRPTGNKRTRRRLAARARAGRG